MGGGGNEVTVTTGTGIRLVTVVADPGGKLISAAEVVVVPGV